ncbi:MAG: transporter substrate-binding domain-containing protein, partial [Bacilli bacterium]
GKEKALSGLMFRKGNEELVAAVDAAIQEMKKDGTLAALSEKYFGVNIYE